MNKKMRELSAKIQEKLAEAKSFMAEGENKDVEKANAIMDEIDALQKEYDAEERAFNLEKANAPKSPMPVEDPAKAPEKAVDPMEAFGKAAKAGFRVQKGTTLNEGTAADGGYAVPKDVLAQINTYKEAEFSMLDLVTKVPVSTNEGSRTFKTRAQHTGFAKVGEKGAIGAKDTPAFEVLTYKISKYAGYFPVTNEELADADASLGATLTKWIADESRATANKLILDAVKTNTETKLAGVDDIKKAINVTLGSAFAGSVQIITNDDGLQYLDTLKDADDHYLLSPAPNSPMNMTLAVGAHAIPVKVVPNAILATVTGAGTGKNETRIPFIVGDLKEGIAYFDRQSMNIAISNTAAIGDLNAFEDDLTIYRAIEREDVKVRDKKAFVNGYILGE